MADQEKFLMLFICLPFIYFNSISAVINAPSIVQVHTISCLTYNFFFFFVLFCYIFPSNEPKDNLSLLLMKGIL